MKFIINPSKLSGCVTVPPSKSHTLRAILFAALAKGTSTITHYLESPDTHAMINACRLLGATIEITATQLIIIGTAGQPQTPTDVIDAGNSGQVLRFIAAIAALAKGYTLLTGDQSIRTNRPIQPLLTGLIQLGGFAVSTKDDGFAPIIIKGPVHADNTELVGDDSQPVSALLILAAFLAGTTQIVVKNPGEKPWIDLTLYWLQRLGISYENNNYTQYKIQGLGTIYPGFNYTVPSDFSSAAFPIVAALITQSEITLENIDYTDIQGDKALIPALQGMGANIVIDASNKRLQVKKSPRLHANELMINNYIDAVTILAVVGCFSQGVLKISGAAIAKQKECDRLAVICSELTKMGGQITETADGLVIQPHALTGTNVASYHDHRIAMSLAIAGLAAQGTTLVNEVACVDKSFPGFAHCMQQLGADIQVLE